VFGMPRQLVVHIEKISPKQDQVEIQMCVPPVKKGFDPHGKCMKEIEGFCLKNGDSIGDLIRKSEGKIEYVCSRIKESTRHTSSS
jgi:glycyl-tRNA synthetase beta subunit